MIASQAKPAHRRGICPRVSAPMPTGDGLLARLIPVGTISTVAFSKLCAAAGAYGNGVVEITARGNIQIRGLTPQSAPRFAAALAALDIAVADGIPVVCNPLAGLDTTAIADVGGLAARLRQALACSSLPTGLAPKVSVVIDGGGALTLDAVATDIRLRAVERGRDVLLLVDIGDESAIGAVPLAHSVTCVMRLLEAIARSGHQLRARDAVDQNGIGPFRAAVADLLASPSEARSAVPLDRPSDPIGAFHLRNRRLAFGVGLAFGHADSTALAKLASFAKAAGATGLRMAPGRALIAIGLEPFAVEQFIAAAEELGFIVRSDDPRRNVLACAGAPRCAAAHIAARAMAPRIAAEAAAGLDGSFAIHISGCAKGCAHPKAAALTIVGTAAGCAMIADGSASGKPFAVVPTNDMVDIALRFVRARKHETSHV